MVQEKLNLSGTPYWDERAHAGYENLGWVNADEPLRKMVELAALGGNELVVDAGTGSQAVLDALARGLRNGGRILGFDISASMLRRKSGILPPNANLLIADIYSVPLLNDSADLVTARMLYHNLDNIEDAVLECKRILKPRGRLIICEYVATDPIVWAFERQVFDIKEKGRNLWTGLQLEEAVRKSWKNSDEETQVSLDFALLTQYSVRDWMRSSGLPQETQQAVVDLYLNASPEIVNRMNIYYTENEDGRDALVDRPFAFVTAVK